MNIKILFSTLLLYSYVSKADTLGIETGLNIPRFVSLKSNDSNLRIGPSKDYPIKLKYIIANTPIEIIDEYKIVNVTEDGNCLPYAFLI